MLDAREWRGVWWDPQKPDEQIAGVLSFSQADAELELIGLLPDPRRDEAPQSGSIELLFGLVDRPRIHGLTVDGKAITLDRCIPRSRTIGSGVPVERHHPGIIIVGHHFDGEIEFDAIEVRFTHLDEWAGLSGFSESLDWTDERKVEAIKVEFRPPEDITATLADGTSLEIGFAWSWSGTAVVTTRAEIEQRAGVVARFPAPRAFDEALKLVGRVRNFLNLGIGHPVHPREVVGVLESQEPDVDEADHLASSRTRVEVLYALSDQPDPSDMRERALLPHEMRFTLRDIHDSLDRRLQAWLDRYDILRPALDLYFGVAYGAVRYLEPRFLSLMQALETYHRRSSSTTVLPEEEHAEWVESVLGAIRDEASRERLARLVEHANEPPLRARLKEVLASCPDVAPKIVGKTRAFLQAAVTGRNYLTHYDPDLEAQAPKGIELLPLAAQVGALLEMCFLREIGFTCEEIDAIFTRVRRYEEIEHLGRIAVGE